VWVCVAFSEAELLIVSHVRMRFLTPPYQRDREGSYYSAAVKIYGLAPQKIVEQH
jgi:hypothetical protein